MSANSIHVMKMCSAFSSIGYDVDLFVPKYSSEKCTVNQLFSMYSVTCRFNVIYVPVFWMRFLSLSFAVALIFSVRRNYSVIYSRSLYSIFLLGMRYPSTILELHFDIWRRGALNPLVFRLYLKLKSSTRLIFITKSLLNDFKKLKIKGGVECKVAFDAADEVRSEGVAWSDARTNGLNLCYIGSLNPGKGMEVISKLSYELSNEIIHIAGGSASQIQQWEKVCNNKNTHFYGFLSQPEVEKLMGAMDVCLLPNQSSTYGYGAKGNNDIDIGKYTSPLKLFQYMAHAKPIVSSNLPVLREVLNQHNALLVSPDNIGEWIDAIHKLRDRCLRKNIGNSAYRDFISKYTWTSRAYRVLDKTG